MEFIAHRINSVKELETIPKDCGVELDLRPWGDKLIMEHDPFKDGEDFEDLLKVYDHGTMILNIKSERIEHKVLELIKKYNIEKYFFLDSSVPMIKLLTSEGESNIAIRFSEIEPVECLVHFKGKVKWVWVDCFSRFILTKELEERIHSMGFRICIVSPELQGRQSDISKHAKAIRDLGIKVDAICSKIYNRDDWNQVNANK